jgi:hypothetical protein
MAARSFSISAQRSPMIPAFSCIRKRSHNPRSIRSVTDTRSLVFVPVGRPTWRLGIVFQAFRAAALKFVTVVVAKLLRDPSASWTDSLLFGSIAHTTARWPANGPDRIRSLSPSFHAAINRGLRHVVIFCNNIIRTFWTFPAAPGQGAAGRSVLRPGSARPSPDRAEFPGSGGDVSKLFVERFRGGARGKTANMVKFQACATCGAKQLAQRAAVSALPGAAVVAVSSNVGPLLGRGPQIVTAT